VTITARQRDAYLRRKYGLRHSQYLAMMRLQDGKCAICRRPPKPGRRLHVDHDHKTGRVRGGLCYPCNHKLLGRGREIPEHHRRAAAYLESDFDGRKL
jgi:hypothetical protein